MDDVIFLHQFLQNNQVFLYGYQLILVLLLIQKQQLLILVEVLDMQDP
jgi:hypothetical protein